MVMPSKRVKLAAPPPRKNNLQPTTVVPEAPPAGRRHDPSIPSSLPVAPITTTPEQHHDPSVPNSGVPHRGVQPNITHFMSAPVNSNVKQMQQALLNLSSTMSKNYLTNMNPKSETRGGSNAFGNFLVNQYINNEDVAGKQFVNVDAHEPARSGTAISNKNLAGIISTIGRIGTPGAIGEKVTDGIWQTRTNNSLKQAAAVAAALIQLQQDMKIPVEGYSVEDLKELRENIPESYTQLSTSASARAQKLTPNIQKLTSFYKNFENSTLNNEKYKSLIVQEKPFTTHNKSSEELSEQESAFLNANMSEKIPHVNINGKAVTLGDISSLEAFKKFLSGANLPPNNSAIINKYVKMVKDLMDINTRGGY